MNDAVTPIRIPDASPRFMARMAGLFFLLTILTAGFAQGFVSGRLVVGGAATTATNILAHKDLYQAGFAVYLIEMACQVVATALFYKLLKPVNGTLSLLAAFISLLGIAIKTFGRLFFIAPLFVLGGGQYLAVFNMEQLQALAFLFLKLNDRAAEMGLVFFGISALLKGYLILRSTVLPRILGVFGICGGVGWLTFLYPPLAYRLFPYILAVALLGSAALILWLLVVGVNEQRWKEQARAEGYLR
jgi:hypothetical protein